MAMGLLAAIMAASGFIFHSAIKSQRTAKATLEIAQKLQAITTQLDADFKNIRKDGEIFIVWTADPLDEHDRFDRILFFADGDFHTYHQKNGDIRGHLARITYMLANDKDGISARYQDQNKRVLSRTQHILVADNSLNLFPDLTLPFDEDKFWTHNNYYYEYDLSTVQSWKEIALNTKAEMLSALCDVVVNTGNQNLGTVIDRNDPNTFDALLCEGVGSFSIQGWYDAEQRWVPEIDPDGDGRLSDDSDFRLDGENIHDSLVPVLWYNDMYVISPVSDSGLLMLGVNSSIGVYNSSFDANLYEGPINKVNFNNIPGLGRAIRFTFTIYDSKGIYPEGKTFSHIVYLDY